MTLSTTERIRRLASNVRYSTSGMLTSTELPDTSTVYTFTIPTDSNCLILQNTGDKDIRLTLDGTNPSTTAGMLLRPSADGGDNVHVIPIDGDTSIKILVAEASATPQVWYQFAYYTHGVDFS